MPKKLACKDIFPGCEGSVEGATEEEVLQKAAKHAMEKHGLKEITPETVKKVKSHIH